MKSIYLHDGVYLTVVNKFQIAICTEHHSPQKARNVVWIQDADMTLLSETIAKVRNGDYSDLTEVAE